MMMKSLKSWKEVVTIWKDVVPKRSKEWEMKINLNDKNAAEEYFELLRNSKML